MPHLHWFIYFLYKMQIHYFCCFLFCMQFPTSVAHFLLFLQYRNIFPFILMSVSLHSISISCHTFLIYSLEFSLNSFGCLPWLLFCHLHYQSDHPGVAVSFASLSWGVCYSLIVHHDYNAKIKILFEGTDKSLHTLLTFFNYYFCFVYSIAY